MIFLQGTKDIECVADIDVTELEVGLDPMMLVQCSLEEDDIDSPFPYISDEFDEKSESENCSDHSETYLKPHKPYCCSLCPRRFPSEFNLLVHTWTHPTHNKRILLNKTKRNVRIILHQK